MFCILLASGLWAWNYTPRSTYDTEKSSKQTNSGPTSKPGPNNLLRSLGISQLLLTILTLSTAHAQIITRISSAYPVWLWYVVISSQKSNSWMAGYIVQFLAMYGVIQGGLYASFLPPA
jgi:phosphatidylinositol glycan class V